MDHPCVQLDRWAFDIECGRCTTGNRIKDSKKHRALAKVRDRLYGRHVKAHPGEFSVLANHYCIDRVIPQGYWRALSKSTVVRKHQGCGISEISER